MEFDFYEGLSLEQLIQLRKYIFKKYWKRKHFIGYNAMEESKYIFEMEHIGQEIHNRKAEGIIFIPYRKLFNAIYCLGL